VINHSLIRSIPRAERKKGEFKAQTKLINRSEATMKDFPTWAVSDRCHQVG
jgi:hypothetical protein